jgi:hypothetical protein
MRKVVEAKVFTVRSAPRSACGLARVMLPQRDISCAKILCGFFFFFFGGGGGGGFGLAMG